MSDQQQKVALITGGNAGIGLALVKRLLQSDPRMHICLACRSRVRAETAQELLLVAYPTATISIQLLDVASVKSVYTAASEIRKRFGHIDFLFLNAGIMPVSTVNWPFFWKQLFSKNCVHMFATGEGLLRQVDETTDAGLKQIFATNVFGHFILIMLTEQTEFNLPMQVRELEDLLGGAGGVGGGGRESRIIWTSSSNASRAAFSIDDITHSLGCEPYGSSKYAADLVSLALNERLNVKGVYSHATCPGLVMTNLTYGILPSWMWFLLLPVLWLLRVFVPSMVVSPENGSEALFWLTQQRPTSLDPRCKFHSCVSILGRPYTRSKPTLLMLIGRIVDVLYAEFILALMKLEQRYASIS